MKIVKLPNSVLRKKTETVSFVTPKIISIIKEMIKTLNEQKNPVGVGLAAPQVDISLSIFLIKPPKGNIEIFINPEILEKKGEYEEKEKNLEGCLSLSGYYGTVKRANKVKISYQTLDPKTMKNPKTITKTFVGFPAVIIQHEIDHLNGTLFIDKILEQKGKLYKIDKDEEDKEVLEEVKL